MDPARRSGPPAAGILGGFAYLLIGWGGLLVPSLIRSIEDAFGQSDAGMGIYYLVVAIGYAAGSLAGGLVTERIGRRTVLATAAALLAGGLALLGLAPAWAWFLLAGLPIGLGAGALDGGGNGLFLDVFRVGRGRALNLLHLCYSLGALAAPLAVGPLVEAGVPWTAFPIVTGLAVAVLGALLLVVRMPTGRRLREPAGPGVGGGDPDGAVRSRSIRGRLPEALILLCLAIGFYVASEVGVTDWLVRFLEPAPLTLATTALALYWGGMAVGRLGSARLADRFDHVRYTTAAALVMSVALVGATLIPSLPISIALFALAGLAAGPVAPMIVVVGGDRYPDRSAAVGAYLTTAAVAGAIGFPTVMGFLSVTVGLTVAMLGTALFGLASAVALVLVGRTRRAERRRAAALA